MKDVRYLQTRFGVLGLRLIIWEQSPFQLNYLVQKLPKREAGPLEINHSGLFVYGLKLAY